MQNGCAADVWGLRGLAPVVALHTPHRAVARFVLAPSLPSLYAERPHGATPMRGKIAAVCVEVPLADFNAHDSTALP